MDDAAEERRWETKMKDATFSCKTFSTNYGRS